MVSWRLHEIMGEKRLKITDVSKAAGLTWVTVSKIYYGKAQGVTLNTIAKLCDGVNCEPGDLFKNDNQ